MSDTRRQTGAWRAEFGFGWHWSGDHWRSANPGGFGNAVLLFPARPKKNRWTVRAYRGQRTDRSGLFCEMVLRGRDAETRAFFLGSSLTCGAVTHSATDD